MLPHPHHPRVASVSFDTPCWLKALPSHPFPSSAKNSENPGVFKRTKQGFVELRDPEQSLS